MAAERVMERVNGVNIVPHFCRIEDKELDFYNDFSIIALGLDSVEARSYINSVACSFLGESISSCGFAAEGEHIIEIGPFICLQLEFF